ncbi:hypothetical protein B0T10DRAFT_500556 [Thelonectria olida]|uniref:Uncharacterized protein n=1 Tax=Thelonectria olida TaxID=1576542 RepID=A0A9P8VR47_9HYPO|nr:hypothetical protein B0T10DRAFT_500556 [Thelonectria olida]
MPLASQLGHQTVAMALDLTLETGKPVPSTLSPIMCHSVDRLRQIAALATEFDRVPNQVRGCLELVRTCDHDLQHLIQLRTEHARLLERHSGAIKRIDGIIKAARKALKDVCKLVENCRPEAHEGRTPLRNKLRWVLVDSRDFEHQEPGIRRHHAAILAELIFIRRVAVMASSSKQFRNRDMERKKQLGLAAKPSQVFENLTLLGDIIGDLSNISIESQSPNKLAPVSTNNTITTCPAPTKTTRMPSPLVNMAYTQVSVECYPSSSPRNKIPNYTAEPIMGETAISLPLPHYNEKEVAFERDQQKWTSECIVLGSTDCAGLLTLFDNDDMIMTPYLTP